MPEKIYEEIIDVMEAVFGKHPGYRRAHAKGIICEGTFSPSATAAGFCRAPHLQGSDVPAIVRFSNFTGLPQIPDGDPGASPRGMAIRFKPPGAGESDII